MKRVLFFVMLTLAAVAVKAQNIQLHYDMGEDRGYATTTVEYFGLDKYGSSFFFIDLDYGSNDVEGVSLAYFEIARSLKFWDSPFELHLEYNGGFGQYMPGGSYQIGNSWLYGAQYTWNSKDFSRIFTLQAMYKSLQGREEPSSFQITGVWTIKLLKEKVTFCGFADLWREDDQTVFLAEPQIWYNATKKLALGTEIELSSNFGGNDGFMVNPTLGAKWTF